MAKKEEKQFKILDFAPDFDKDIDEIGAKLKMLSVNLSRCKKIEHSISSGSLIVDLITGGGYVPGSWTNVQGESGSGKTTLYITALRNAVNTNIPIYVFDYEGGTSLQLLENIVNQPLENIMGVKDSKGNWAIKPIIRHYQPAVGEDGYRFCNRLLKRLPDKVEIDGRWFLVFDKTESKKFEDDGFRVMKKDDFCYVETKDGSAQAIIFIDSIASMLPEVLEEDDEKAPLAKLAQMNSQYIPMIVTKLNKKRVIVVAANQMRIRPMAYGDPRYACGGTAPAFYSGLTLDMRPIAPSSLKEEGTSKLGTEEPCWDGVGTDKYKYTKLFTEKIDIFLHFEVLL